MQAGDGDLEGGLRVHPRGDVGQAPGKDDDAYDQPGKPCFENGGGGVAVGLSHLSGDVFAVDVERAPGLPEAEKNDEDDDGGRGGDDGH